MQIGTRRSTNSLWLYFGLAFGITWLIWSPGILDAMGWIDLPCPFLVFFFVGTWGPFAAASIVTAREGGWGPVKAFWKQGLDFHLSWGWIGLILAFCVFVSVVPLGLYLLAGGFAPEAELLKQPWMILPVFLTYFFTGGANEEWGWRGFALDRLQLRWRPLKASILLGLIWGTWHLPLFFIPSTGQYHMIFWIFLAAAPAISLLHTWFYNASGGKLIAAWFLHAVIGACWEIFPIVQPKVEGYEVVFVYDMLAVVLVAVGLLLYTGPRLGLEGRAQGFFPMDESNPCLEPLQGRSR